MEGLKLGADQDENEIEEVIDMGAVKGGDNGDDKGSALTTTKKVENFSICDRVEDGDTATAEVAQTESVPKSSGEVEETAQIKFYPPVYIQRYCRVVGILKESLPAKTEQLKTILEVGCAEFSMHVYLNKLKGVGKLIYLDIDAGLLEDRKLKLRPLPIDYIHKRETPLQVVAYAGCVTKADPVALTPTYAVVAIEIVEHLDPPILEGFVTNVFCVIRPSLVIVTTPNSEFNVMFNLPKGKFRHWDHRFEWTRSEFQDWCDSVCKSYPSYSYTIEGVGAGPAETEDLGCVSQLAIFRHDPNTPAEPDYSVCEGIEPGTFYKLIAEENYPFYLDPTPRDEKILREFKYYIQAYVLTPSSIEDYVAEGVTFITTPISHYCRLNGMPEDVTEEELIDVLKAANYKILEQVNDNDEKLSKMVVLDVPDPVYSSDSESDENEDDNHPVYVPTYGDDEGEEW